MVNDSGREKGVQVQKTKSLQSLRQTFTSVKEKLQDKTQDKKQKT